VTFDQVAGLASRRTDALRSSFRPTYNMTVNLVRRYDAETAHRLLNLSFAQFHTDREVVALERQLERVRERLVREQERAHSDHGDIDEYRRLRAELDQERRQAGSERRMARALAAVRPGDVVWARRRGKVVVLAHDDRRGQPRVLALTPTNRLVRLGSDDFDAAPKPLGQIELPEPYAPRSRAFQRAAVDALRRLDVRRADVEDVDGADRADELAAAIAAHPVDADPQRDARVRAAANAERVEREIVRLERRVRGRTETLARQLDQVRQVLESWGYVDGWSLTPAGEMLARLYTETDLLLAESLREGLLDTLTPSELAAVVSCFAYERRGADDAAPVAPLRWPTGRVAEKYRRIERLWRALVANEDDAGLPQMRPPDPGFTPYVYEWSTGEGLGDVLEDDELAGGDFVRNIKQCVDLLGQVAEVAPDGVTRATAREAIDSCLRGVIRAATVVTT
jgi:ATP-dependent RNA helicase HelY